MPPSSRRATASPAPWWPFWLVIALLPFGRSAEAGTAFCLVGLLVLGWRQRDLLVTHGGARLLLVLLACYVGAALLSDSDALVPGKSWSSTAGLLRYLPLGLYACLAIRRGARLRQLYTAVAVVVALWCVDAWVQALTGWSLGGPAEAERISGIFGADNLKLGPSVAVLSPFVLWAADRRWGWRGLLLAFALVLGPVLLAGSRAGWVCLALVALLFGWRAAGSARRFALLGACAALLLIGAGGLAWKLSGRFHERMERTLLVLNGSGDAVNTALSGRLDIWSVSARMIAAHPINGVGVRGFRYAYPDYAPPQDHFLVAEACGVGEGACHAHQVVLEVLSETGVLGLMLWLAGTFWALRRWWQAAPRRREQAFPASVALAAMLFPFNTHFAFYSAWWGLVFAWLLSLWCAALFMEEDDESEAAA